MILETTKSQAVNCISSNHLYSIPYQFKLKQIAYFLQPRLDRALLDLQSHFQLQYFLQQKTIIFLFMRPFKADRMSKFPFICDKTQPCYTFGGLQYRSKPQNYLFYRSMHIYNYFLVRRRKRPMNVFLDLYPLPQMDTQKQIADKTFPKPSGVKESLSGHRNRPQKKNEKYRWTQAENQRYIRFLAKNSSLFSLSFKEKKNLQINKKMSFTVKSRTPSQCHTHHQKMMMKYGSIEAIVTQNPPLPPRGITLCQAKLEAFQQVQELPFSYSSWDEGSKITWQQPILLGQEEIDNFIISQNNWESSYHLYLFDL